MCELLSAAFVLGPLYDGLAVLGSMNNPYVDACVYNPTDIISSRIKYCSKLNIVVISEVCKMAFMESLATFD